MASSQLMPKPFSLGVQLIGLFLGTQDLKIDYICP